MPQPIAYNTGSQTSGSIKLFGIEYAISSSIVSGSNNQRWFSSVNPGNGIVFVTSNYTQSFGTYQASVPLFFTASDYIAAAITGAINGLPDRFGQVPFTTTSSAYAWVQNSGKYFMMNYEYPQIVTDKLVLNLDASFLASYPTTASTWYDLSGNENNGTLVNGPTFDNGSIVFDGVDDYVTTQTGIVFGANVTYNAWVNRISSVNTFNMFMGKGSLPYFGIRSNNNIIFSNSISGTQRTLQTQTPLISPDNRWYYLSFSQMYDGTDTTMIIYINGVPIISNTFSGISITSTSTNAFTIGVRNANDIYPFNGKVSQVSVYNRTLTNPEILQNYYGGPIITDGLVFAVDAGNLVSYERGSTTTYSLTGSLSGSLVNGVGFSEGYGRSWMFDGTNDKIQVNNFPQIFDGSLTMECWIWWNDDTRSIMFGNYNAGANDVNFEKLDSRRLRMYWNRGERDIFTSTNFVDLNTWQHIVIQRDVTNNVFRFYVNGQLKQSTSNVGSGIPSTGTTFRIGADSRDGATVTNGNIAIMKLYNRALSADEVSQNFQAQRSRFGM
jgi:hypothetical protein